MAALTSTISGLRFCTKGDVVAIFMYVYRTDEWGRTYPCIEHLIPEAAVELLWVCLCKDKQEHSAWPEQEVSDNTKKKMMCCELA